jgi:hypothetical protein
MRTCLYVKLAHNFQACCMCDGGGTSLARVELEDAIGERGTGINGFPAQVGSVVAWKHHQ